MVCVHSVVVPVPLPGPAAYDVFAFFFGCDCCRSLDASVRNGKAKRVLSEPSCCDALPSARIPVLRMVQAARAHYLKVPSGGSSSGSSVTGEAELRGGGNPGPPGNSGSGGSGVMNKDLLAGGRKGSGSSSVMQAPLGRLTSIDEAAALSGLHGEVAMMAPARLP